MDQLVRTRYPATLASEFPPVNRFLRVLALLDFQRPLFLIAISSSFVYFPFATFVRDIGLAIKWSRVLLLGGIDKIRDHLIANLIFQDISLFELRFELARLCKYLRACLLLLSVGGIDKITWLPMNKCEILDWQLSDCGFSRYHLMTKAKQDIFSLERWRTTLETVVTAIILSG